MDLKKLLLGEEVKEETPNFSDDNLLTLKQVQDMLQVSQVTLWRYEKAGKLKAYYLTPGRYEGKRTRPEHYRGKRFLKSDILKLLTPYEKK